MTLNKVKVLVIEDEGTMAHFLRTTLQLQEYEVLIAANAHEGLVLVTTRQPDVLLLDLGLPDRDGLEVIKTVRDWSEMPIIVLSARGKESDKVTALDLGADDYLTKPFSTEELLARIRVALRGRARSETGSMSVWTSQGLEVDLAKRSISRAGNEIHLTPIEYKLLCTLIKYEGRVVTHSQLLREIWGTSMGYEAHNVRVFVASIRRKIELDTLRPRLIFTEVGVGYRLVEGE